MTINRGSRAVSGLVLVAMLAVALMACGSDKKDDKGGSASVDSPTTTSGKKLDDCAYAKQLTDDLGQFTMSLPDTSAASITGVDQGIDALNKLDSEMVSFISQMKGYQLSGDVAKVNSAFISFFEDFRNQIPEVRKAAQSGDTSKLSQFTVTFGTDLNTKLEKIHDDNKGAFDKLNKCQL